MPFSKLKWWKQWFEAYMLTYLENWLRQRCNPACDQELQNFCRDGF